MRLPKVTPEQVYDAPPALCPRRRVRGMTLVEVILATGILLLTSLSLAYAFSSTELASRSSERALVARASIESVAEGIADVAYTDLLSWNGVVVARGDQSVTVATSLVQVGLILVELRVIDGQTGAVLARLATYRASET